MKTTKNWILPCFAAHKVYIDEDDNAELDLPDTHGSRKGILVAALAVVFVLIVSAVMTMDTWSQKPKTFICDSFEIVLTTAFSDSYEDETYYFSSKDCLVAVYEFDYLRHADITEMDEQAFLEMLQSSGHFLPESKIVSESGLKFIEENAESVSGNIMRYFTVFVKGDEAFYLFEFGCSTKDYDEYRASFFEWASSVKIK